MNNNIKNIIFDLGNVLISFNPEKYLEENVKENIRNDFLNKIFKSKEWLDLDRGILTYNEAKKIFKEKIPNASIEIDKYFDIDIYNMLGEIKENTALIQNLKSKYNLYILSNFHKNAFENLNKKYEFFKYFDGHVVSCYYNQLKPEVEIYENILNKFNLIPSETLFIDDTEVNIKMAKSLGINGLHLKDYTQLKENLIKLLGEI